MQKPNPLDIHKLDLHNFLYCHRRYHGQFKPEVLVFNANLQELAQRVSYISNLETAGKISPQEAYQQINALWEQLECSYLALGTSPDAENEIGIGDC